MYTDYACHVHVRVCLLNIHGVVYAASQEKLTHLWFPGVHE